MLRATSLASFGCLTLSSDARRRCVRGCMDGSRAGGYRRSENELLIAPERGDGTLQDPRIVWVVRHGDDVYLRSVTGWGGAGSEDCRPGMRVMSNT